MLHEVFVLFFSSINLFIYFSKLSILISISSNVFSRFFVSLQWVRTCSFSSEKFVITRFLKTVSVNSSDSFSVWFCSLAGEDPLEKERCSGFGCLHPFCSGFFPSLWIYLPVVFEVGDFQMGSLSGCPFC